ncbi:hypothetical protein L6164_037311 [Bauhinia variegata]|uniref:Uncharacterized protein n=1 Tax=Bauhinia variegata TaxID=167791 RepID=A0ACB9KJM7_BAUVA|nr:hypothetical protein L6164_037311 [Bauhinia variegata]
MAEVAIPLAAPALGEVVKILSTESTFEIRHILALSKNLDETYQQLILELEWLLQVEKDNEREVQRLEDKDTNGVYNLWKNNVAKIAGEVHELRTKYEGRRLPRWHILKRSRLSEKMDKLRRLVCDLSQKGSLEDFLVDKEPQCVLKELDVPEIMRYETLQNAFRNVLDLIKDSNTKAKAIGVYGIKGVGKTAILQNLNNNVEVAQLFDIVIFMGMSTN